MVDTVSTVAKRIAAKMHTLAETLNENEQANAVITRYFEAKIDIAVGPPSLYALIKGTYKEDVLDALPIPGVKMEDTDPETKVVTKNNNPDEYLAPKADGSAGTVSRYRHWDFADGLTEGKAILSDIARARVIREKDEDEADRIQDLAEKRQTTLRELVRKSFALYHQIRAMEGYTGAEFLWVKERKPVFKTDDDGNIVTDKDGNGIQLKDKDGKPKFESRLARTLSPCRIVRREKDEEGNALDGRKDMSVTQFLGLDIALATSKGGGYDELLKTLQREQEEENGKGIVPKLEKLADFSQAMVRVFDFLDDADKFKVLNKAAAVKSEANDEILRRVNDAFVALKGFIGGVEDFDDRVDTAEKRLAA